MIYKNTRLLALKEIELQDKLELGEISLSSYKLSLEILYRKFSVRHVGNDVADTYLIDDEFDDSSDLSYKDYISNTSIGAL